MPDLTDGAVGRPRGYWVVDRYEDDPDCAFIGEIGGDICLIDFLDPVEAEQIAAAHNKALGALWAGDDHLQAERLKGPRMLTFSCLMSAAFWAAVGVVVWWVL